MKAELRIVPTVFIALGSNLGDPTAQVRRAMGQLAAISAGPTRSSSLWRSTPEHCPPGSPDFVNAVVQVTPRPNDTPEAWLEKLQALEREFGRQPKTQQNEPRPLDLDLILWGDERRSTPSLTLPHPRATSRRFVLAPLAELAPDWVFPGQSRTVRELLSEAPPDPGLCRLAAA